LFLTLLCNLSWFFDILKDVKAAATTEVKTGQRRTAASELVYFTERDRWFRESVTDAVRLHS
jgi:hypothetical protein